jgi:hypothetical protein
MQLNLEITKMKITSQNKMISNNQQYFDGMNIIK